MAYVPYMYEGVETYIMHCGHCDGSPKVLPCRKGPKKCARCKQIAGWRDDG